MGKPVQPKLRIDEPGDVLEQEADRVAEQVMRMTEARRMAEPNTSTARRVQRRMTTTADGDARSAPSIVHDVLASPGQPLDPTTRSFFEPRFGHDFSTVRVHAGGTAERSAQEVNAHAYTVGQHIVFDAGRYSPETREGRELLAHELTHVVQQSGAGGVLQRRPARQSEAHYQKLVKQGKWCRDSEKSGELHPGLQCYREIPARRGYPAADQVCFSKETGKFVESSPDFISAVSGQKKDGTCDIPMELTDPPQPLTQRGRRALGHAIADIATEDPDLIGRHFGRISGVAMGIVLPKGIDSNLASFAVPTILGFLTGELGERGLPRLNSLARRHGFLPTISLGGGSNFGIGIGVGLEKRDRPLPLVPINTYLTFNLDSTLSFSGPGESSSFLAKVGVRIDPGKQGGIFALGSVGAGLALGEDVSAAASAEVGAGIRATDFLDVQLVRETVAGDAQTGATYWLTLKLVAPQRVYKGHVKRSTSTKGHK
jgi:hypothetical protein